MSERKPDSDVDETQIRQKPNDDKTNVRAESSESKIEDSEVSNSADTIIRSDTPADAGSSSSREASKAASATILRDGSQPNPVPPSNPEPPSDAGSATILRDPSGLTPEGATILREPASSSQATILRDGVDEDKTILNVPEDDDSTIVAGGGAGTDTTYIAAIGNQASQPKGNTEAGRLLKNRFVLEEKVGSGGMGDVYKALDLRQQEAQERNPYIAIKILNESFARHKDAFISLQRETTRTRGIPHPNIMAVYDFDKEGDTVFMSMELLDGKPLDDYLKDHPEGVSVEDAWNIIDGICKGLGRAHDAGIVHSDFKPGNIYYTTEKNCKVFDFGIARAVSSPGELEVDGEKTVFDAGSLGALTPTYASYEMLKGLEPTKSDDVYAVALVAYELFTGKHPYNRLPADKALERGLTPAPVPFLKRRHWKALRKALEIKGEDRTQSIDEFYQGMFSEDPPYFRYAAIAAVLVASIGFGIYQQLYGGAEQLPEEFTSLQGAYSASGRTINERVREPNVHSADWQNQIEVALNRMSLLKIELQEQFPEYLDEGFEAEAQKTIHEQQLKVMNAYLQEVEKLRAFAETSVADTSNEPSVAAAVETLKQAESYVAIVKEKYNFDSKAVSDAELNLNTWKTLREFQLETILRNKEAAALAEQQRIEAEERRIAQEAADAARDAAYNAEIAAFENILRCKGDIPDEQLRGEQGLDKIIQRLKTIHPERFEIDKPGITAALAGCITQRVAVRAPDRARTIKAAALTFLPGEQLLADIEIIDLDPCAARGLEGQGVRNRSWCVDRLSVGGTGPELVVIPPKPGIERFAISRIEIRVGDYNQYCEDTGCEKLPGSASIPATNISLEQAKNYIAWLSDQSGQHYRLPTTDEWLHAATTTTRQEVDDNVNCTVDSRGVRLGDKLLSTLSGRPNSWGLYNHVGNAREWAIEGDEVFALGGAHTDPKAECTLSKRVAHSGQADPVTGFRIIRQI